jgi:uroporphyrinogen decarboxylase
MKPRERVIAALDHQEPDRVPLDFVGGTSSITLQAYVKLKEYLGWAWEANTDRYDLWNVMAAFDPGVLRLFDIDFRCVGLRLPAGWRPRIYPDGTFSDEWGLRRRASPDGLYNEILPAMGGTVEKDDIENFPWPDPHALGITDGLRKEAEELETAGWAVSTSHTGGGIFELAWWLRGFNNFVKDMYTNASFTNAFLDKITEVTISLYDTLLGEVGDYVQMVRTGDDLGSQTGLLISPALYRKFIKPRHKRLFDFIHSRTEAKIYLHSDGAIEPLIDDLIEIGLDILNPVQPLASGMDSHALKKKYGDRLCFHGGIDIQKVLPHGSPQDVDEEVDVPQAEPGGSLAR